MDQKFQSAVQNRADVSYVKLSGVIDEDNSLGALSEQIHGRTVVVDLGEVERINSYGARDWVHWIARLDEAGAAIVLVKCSPAIVAQINLISNFTGSGVVKSFYVPYFCAECDEEKLLLCETAEMGPPPHGPPTCRCDECDLVMAFDDMADVYFAFLAQQTGRQGERSADARLPGEAPGHGPGDPSRVSATGTVSSVHSSLPSVPSLPGFPSRSESTSDFSSPSGDLSQPSTEGEEDGPGIPPERPPQPRSAAAAQVFIGMLLLGLAALAYVLFAEP